LGIGPRTTGHRSGVHRPDRATQQFVSAPREVRTGHRFRRVAATNRVTTQDVTTTVTTGDTEPCPDVSFRIYDSTLTFRTDDGTPTTNRAREPGGTDGNNRAKYVISRRRGPSRSTPGGGYRAVSGR
jgi:hypothetical protein